MRAKDVMTVDPVVVGPDATVVEIAQLLLQHRISGVPVVDAERRVLGVVTEGDLVRRPEIAPPRRRAWWLGLFTGEQPDAEFVKTHGRFAREIMSQPAVVVEEETPIGEVAQTLEERGIKRVPVVRDGKLAGIVSRADLLRALAAAMRPAPAAALDDRALREAVLAEMARQRWPMAGVVNVIVTDGTVHFWGVRGTDEDPMALTVLAENVPGVQAVRDHRVRLPYSL